MILLVAFIGLCLIGGGFMLVASIRELFQPHPEDTVLFGLIMGAGWFGAGVYSVCDLLTKGGGML